MKQTSRVRKCIQNARTIVIACHRNPDGDALGSLLALGLGLKKIGKQVTMVSIDGIPRLFAKLPGAKEVVRAARTKYDLAIAVDCGKKDVLGKAYHCFEEARMTIEIDHHDFREPFASVCYVDTTAAAVGEIVYKLLKELKVSIDAKIAENVITSLIVETNSFRLPSVTARTFQICAELLCCGIDYQRITNTIYWARSRNSVLLSSFCIARSVFLLNGELIWSIVRQRDLKKYKARHEDVDMVADEMRAIKDVKIAILFREEGKGRLRVSLRSKGKINVATLARKYCGGGHFDVAGCVISGGPKAQQRLIADAKRLLKQE